jgi:hypothetical protein
LILCVLLSSLHRKPKHIHDFLVTELGTSASVNGNSQLILKGRFRENQIESIMKRYIKEYVKCRSCCSVDTILDKDIRLSFLQCMACRSRYSVARITSGFKVTILFSLALIYCSKLFLQLYYYCCTKSRRMRWARHVSSLRAMRDCAMAQAVLSFSPVNIIALWLSTLTYHLEGEE